MYLRKAQAGSAPDITWEEDDEVREVPDVLAEQLLAIPNGGFSIAEPPESEEAPKNKGGRPPLPRDENGKIIRD